MRFSCADQVKLRCLTSSGARHWRVAPGDQGHASITTTLDLYGHLYPDDMDRYADRLGEAAGQVSTARIRPAEPEGEADEEASGL